VSGNLLAQTLRVARLAADDSELNPRSNHNETTGCPARCRRPARFM
jgi:hypothetical protein